VNGLESNFDQNQRIKKLEQNQDFIESSMNILKSRFEQSQKLVERTANGLESVVGQDQRIKS